MEKQYYVQMKDVNKSFGSFQASKNINFGIEKGKLVGLLKLAGIALLGGEGIDGLGAALLALGDDGDETGDAFGESLTVLDLHTHRALATGKLNLGVAVLAVIAKKPHVSSRLAMKDSKKLKDTLAISVTRHAHKSVLKALST